MNNRAELQSKLEEILDSRHVYYQPPESLKMEYPCIRYEKADISTIKANNSNYALNTRYELTHISKKPDSPVITDLLSLPYCSYDRHFCSDNLHHDVLTIYY